jgi:hypothetical protein
MHGLHAPLGRLGGGLRTGLLHILPVPNDLLLEAGLVMEDCGKHTGTYMAANRAILSL